MARPKEFEVETAVDAAIAVFREHGFEGTSAQMLVDAMCIGRQSLYDTFGDKRGIYLEAVRRYSEREIKAHREMLEGGATAIDGIRAMLSRVAAEAREGCLGVSSAVEFGTADPKLVAIRNAAGGVLSKLLADTVRRGQAEGAVAAELRPEPTATFIVATVAGIRIAARSGASDDDLTALVEIALRALR